MSGASTVPASNRRVTLARLPRGMPVRADFALVEEPAGTPGAGEVLLRTLYLSMDPYQRSWMAGGNYGAPAAPGATVIGRAVCEVLASRDPRFAAGQFVFGETGWQTHPVVAGDKLQGIDPSEGPISTAVGVLGSPGLTGWVGMTDICQPAAGETVVVSAATGAVGSVAGQVAKLRGARVVGVAGAAEKCRFAVDTLGFDACVSHKSADFAEDLTRACPSGVDAYFDNTGGAVTAAVFTLLRQDARVALCGLVAEYGDEDARGPAMKHVLAAQALVRGFSVRRNLHRMAEYRALAAGWMREGRRAWREDITEGIENAPEAFAGMLLGRNLGKALVRVSADPTR